MNKQKEAQAKIEEIQKSTGIKVRSYKVINSGMENLVIEINDAWIFRFPRNSTLRANAKERLHCLISFSKTSSSKIPNPEYITNTFVGYKKIPGQSFHPPNLKKLTAKARTKIEKQLGLFLKALHNHKDRRINFDTGYLVMRRKDYKICPPAIAKRLSSDERKALEAKLKTIGDNPLNFKKPTSVIHGDLNFNNILWDSKKKIITGIIDWGELGLGVPAMDFIMLADFNGNANDIFLKNILQHYGTHGDDLFYKLKRMPL